MKLVVGLGNPDDRYEGTRHNIGFDAVRSLADQEGISVSKKGFSSLWAKAKFEGKDVLLALPQTYMNLSGEAVRAVIDYYRLEPKDLVTVHDDLDLALGRVKWDFDAGAGGHRGVGSVIDHLGTKSFYRVRMGIGRPQRKEAVEGFVLSPFEKAEREAVDAMIVQAVQYIRNWLNE